MSEVAMETKQEVLNRATRRLRRQVASHGVNETTLSILRLYERRYEVASGQEGDLALTALDCLVAHPEIGILCEGRENHTGDHWAGAHAWTS